MPGKDAIKITYKESMLKVPVFRNNRDQPWSTAEFREVLQKMGILAGFEQLITPYHSRRGCNAAMQGISPTYFCID